MTKNKSVILIIVILFGACLAVTTYCLFDIKNMAQLEKKEDFNELYMGSNRYSFEMQEIIQEIQIQKGVSLDDQFRVAFNLGFTYRNHELFHEFIAEAANHQKSFESSKVRSQVISLTNEINYLAKNTTLSKKENNNLNMILNIFKEVDTIQNKYKLSQENIDVMDKDIYSAVEWIDLLELIDSTYASIVR